MVTLKGDYSYTKKFVYLINTKVSSKSLRVVPVHMTYSEALEAMRNDELDNFIDSESTKEKLCVVFSKLGVLVNTKI